MNLTRMEQWSPLAWLMDKYRYKTIKHLSVNSRVNKETDVFPVN